MSDSARTGLRPSPRLAVGLPSKKMIVKSEVAERFLAEKCVTDVACAGVGRWPGRLSPNPSSATLTGVGQGVGRVDARATDANVSVCRSVREGGFGSKERQTLRWSCDGRWHQRLSRVASVGLRASAVRDVEPRLLIDRQTRLSRLSAVRELFVPRLSCDGR
jgi:hypothetical protein